MLKRILFFTCNLFVLLFQKKKKFICLVLSTAMDGPMARKKSKFRVIRILLST